MLDIDGPLVSETIAPLGEHHGLGCIRHRPSLGVLRIDSAPAKHQPSPRYPGHHSPQRARGSRGLHSYLWRVKPHGIGSLELDRALPHAETAVPSTGLCYSLLVALVDAWCRAGGFGWVRIVRGRRLRHSHASRFSIFWLCQSMDERDGWESQVKLDSFSWYNDGN